jgi:4-amino-4-deoxy-L-arabinose transferase-like glycosyltransferase
VSRDVARGSAVVLSVALALALLLPGLGAAPFDDPGEGQHAEIAREIGASGNWLVLRLNGVRYFDKPPLLYWLTAGAFAVLGVGEWAARLAPLGGAVLAAAATAVLGARLLGPAAGFAAAGALLSSALFVVFGRYVRPETLFVAAIQWGMSGVLLGLIAPPPAGARRGWFLVGCAGLAVASVAKDPLGLIGPLAAVTAALALAGRLGSAWTQFSWVGVAVLLVGGFGWYLVAGILSPGFLWYTVVDNHLLNLLRLRRFPDEDVPVSTAEFLAISGLGAFPWSIPAALQIVDLARRRAWRNGAEAPWVALALWVTGLVALFVIAPFKLPHYALPVYPAVALLAVRRWTECAARPRALVGGHLVLFAALAVAAGVIATGDGRAFIETVFSATDVYTRKEAVVGQASPLPPWSALGPLVARAATVFVAGALVLAVAFWARSGRLGLVAVLATMLAVMPLALAGAGLVASGRAVAGIAADLRQQMAAGDLLVHEGPIENSGALELYSGRRPLLLDARRSVLGMGATYPEARDTFWDAGDLRRAWQSGRRVFLVTPRAPANSVVAALHPAGVHLLAQKHGRWLYSNVGARAAEHRSGPVAGGSPPGLP